MTVEAAPVQRSPRPSSTFLRRSAILGGVAAAFGFVWLFGMFGFGRISEDLCLYDMMDADSSYGGSTMRVEAWPPSVVCELRGSDVPDLVVHHRVRGALWGVWTFVAPLVMFGAFVALALVMRTRPPLASEPVSQTPGDQSEYGT